MTINHQNNSNPLQYVKFPQPRQISVNSDAIHFLKYFLPRILDVDYLYSKE